MGFWIFMLIMSLLCPAIMIIFGIVFFKNAPKEINYLFGYRTELSMKNRDTWEFAHRYCGKLWMWIGSILLPLSILPLLFVIGQSKDVIGSVGLIICLVEIVILIVSIFPTEIALHKHFDADGNRIPTKQ